MEVPITRGIVIKGSLIRRSLKAYSKSELQARLTINNTKNELIAMTLLLTLNLSNLILKSNSISQLAIIQMVPILIKTFDNDIPTISKLKAVILR